MKGERGGKRERERGEERERRRGRGREGERDRKGRRGERKVGRGRERKREREREIKNDLLKSVNSALLVFIVYSSQADSGCSRWRHHESQQELTGVPMPKTRGALLTGSPTIFDESQSHHHADHATEKR